METEDNQRLQREKQMQRLVKFADSFLMQHGRFPSKIRVGADIARRLFPSGEGCAVTPDFTVELDDALQSDEVKLDV